MDQQHKMILHDGQIDLGGAEIGCYVLEDGTRVLSSREMQRALNLVDDETDYQVSGARLKRYLGQKSLKPFLYKDKEEGHYEPLICYNGKTKIHGYEATVLVDVCDAFMQARIEITLSPRQAIIADQCEMLVRSFAKIGIIALIDEATGYKKAQDEYMKRFGMYLAEEMRPWVKTFEESYFKNVYKLMGWDWSMFASGQWKNHPQVVGKITNAIVYNKLPKGILQELDRINPKNERGNRKHKHHQFLSESIGYRELIQHLGKIDVISSMYGFGEYKKAKAHLDQLIPDQREGSQIGLDIPIESDNYEKISSASIGSAEKEPSSFDKNLQIALAYNPKD